MSGRLRPVEATDLPGMLELNNEWVPEVGEIDASRLAHIVGQASLALVAHDDGELLGFVLVLDPAADYDSPNFAWFTEHVDDFRYVDRIVVSASAHRRGVGRELYSAVFEHARSAGAPTVTCEVNVDPPNPTSMAFHRSLGFDELGQQVNYGGAITVAMLGASTTDSD